MRDKEKDRDRDRNQNRNQDRDLEELLREHFRTPSVLNAPSPRVVEAVLRQIRFLPQEAPASPLNTLAWVLAALTVLGWLTGQLWLSKVGFLGAIFPGPQDLLWNHLAFWMLSSAFQAIKVLILSGFGELFPLVLAGIMGAMILTARLHRRAAR